MNARNIFLVITLAAATGLDAQNRTLILKSNESIGNILTADSLAEPGGYGPYDYHLAPIPVIIRNSFSSRLNITEAANNALTDFQTQHIRNNYIDFGDDFLRRVHYGFDGALHLPSTDDVPDNVYEQATEKFKTTVFSNRLIRESIYNWLISAYKNAFSLMSVPEQHDYLTMFREGRDFADTFNLKREKEIAEDPYVDYPSRKGQLGAFVYRRVANGELTREECLEWLDRIISDLSSVVHKNPTAEDSLVLIQELQYDYFVAADYRKSSYYYDGEVYILRRTNGKFKKLPGVHFDYTDDFDQNVIAGSVNINDSTSRRAIFYSDSVQWYFNITDYEGRTDIYYWMGEGKDARLLFVNEFVYDWDQYGEYVTDQRALMTLVDLDSGYVVRDHLYFDFESVYDPEGYERYYFQGIGSETSIYYQTTPKGKLFGLMDKNGNILLEPKYKSIERTDNPDLFVVNGKKQISVREQGKKKKRK